MSRHYLITVTDEGTAEMERWTADGILLIPSPWGNERAVHVSSIDKLTDEEFLMVAQRLATPPDEGSTP